MDKNDTTPGSHAIQLNTSLEDNNNECENKQSEHCLTNIHPDTNFLTKTLDPQNSNMAPDLNSVPASPRPLAASTSPRITSRNTSRRASQQMAPPPLPPTSPLNILPSNQSAVNHIGSPPLVSPTMQSTTMTAAPIGDNTGVGTGPGPLRHPRPLTAADLHLQLEKEQEAVVCIPVSPTYAVTNWESIGQPTYTRTLHAPRSTKCLRRIERLFNLHRNPRFHRHKRKPPPLRPLPPPTLSTQTPPILLLNLHP